MTISKRTQVLLLIGAFTLLALYSFSTGYGVGKDIAANERGKNGSTIHSPQ